jgi:hypothetical protein
MHGSTPRSEIETAGAAGLRSANVFIFLVVTSRIQVVGMSGWSWKTTSTADGGETTLRRVSQGASLPGGPCEVRRGQLRQQGRVIRLF